MGENLAPPDVTDVQASIERNKPTINRLSHTHSAIARWLLENPTLSLGECAKHFSYTQAWLSCIIHSDAFQVQLRKMQSEADAIVIMDVPARLRGIAAVTLDGIAAQVDHAVRDGNGVLHREFLHQTAELTLKALGYGQAKAPPPPPAGSTHYHNHKHLTVTPEVLETARGKLLEAHAVQEASQLPASGDSDLSSVQRHSTLVPAPPTTEGSQTSRADISSTSGGVAP